MIVVFKLLLMLLHIEKCTVISIPILSLLLTKSSKIKAPPGCRVLYGDSSVESSLSSAIHKFMEWKGNDHDTIFCQINTGFICFNSVVLHSTRIKLPNILHPILP